MRLFTSPRAPNPRRVLMFLHEKGITGIDFVPVDLNAGEHKAAAYRAKVPVARVPALELADGRVLSETRAICSYLEGLHPAPNLMGEGFEERAFIEMHDRRVEWYWLLPIANCVRHTHPGLAALEQPQFPNSASRRPSRCASRPVGWTTRWPRSPGSPASASPLPTSRRSVPSNSPS